MKHTSLARRISKRLATTGFALVGLHATQQCTACHVSNNYSLTTAACIDCHLADVNGTTNPSHKAAGFSQDCSPSIVEG